MNKDYLQNLIQYTYGIGCIDIVKITGTDTETKINSVDEQRTVVIYGSFSTPIADFIGTFGMPNLSKLKTILGFDDYDDTSTIEVLRGNANDPEVPSAIHFETINKDFINDYRLMTKNIIENKIPDIVFHGSSWAVEFEPSIAGILRLKKQASANSEELNFRTRTENGDLKIYFGDHSSHSGNFVFQPNVSGKLTTDWNWPVKVFLSILDLPGDKTIRISNEGAVEITVDSGLAVYRYLVPALSK